MMIIWLKSHLLRYAFALFAVFNLFGQEEYVISIRKPGENSAFSEESKIRIYNLKKPQNINQDKLIELLNVGRNNIIFAVHGFSANARTFSKDHYSFFQSAYKSNDIIIYLDWPSGTLVPEELGNFKKFLSWKLAIQERENIRRIFENSEISGEIFYEIVSNIVMNVRRDTHISLIAHSMGCNLSRILLTGESIRNKLRGIVFVAPCIRVEEWKSDIKLIQSQKLTVYMSSVDKVLGIAHPALLRNGRDDRLIGSCYSPKKYKKTPIDYTLIDITCIYNNERKIWYEHFPNNEIYFKELRAALLGIPLNDRLGHLTPKLFKPSREKDEEYPYLELTASDNKCDKGKKDRNELSFGEYARLSAGDN